MKKNLIPVLCAATCLAALSLGTAHARNAAVTTVTFDTKVDRPLLVKDAGEQKVIIKIDVGGIAPEKKLARLPLNIALVIDRSGSMTGKKLEQAKQAAEMLVDQLSSDDVFSLVMYDTDVDVLVGAQPVGNKRGEFKRVIRRIEAGGSTALYHGVETGGAQLEEYFGRHKINRVLLLSDGIANVGPSSNREIAQLGQRLARRQISVSTIGLGEDYNEDLMTALAEASDANYYYVSNVEALPEVFRKELGELQTIVAREIIIEVICPDGVRPIKFYGRPEQFQNRRGVVKFGTLAGEQSRELVLECRVDPATFREGTPIAEVRMAFDDTAARSNRELKRKVVVGFTADEGLADKARDEDVTTVSEIYRNNEESQRALALADSGKIAECRTQLKQQISSLEKLKGNAPASRRAAVQGEIDALRNTEQSLDDNYGLDAKGRKAFQSGIYRYKNSKEAVK